jgi:integrase
VQLTHSSEHRPRAWMGYVVVVYDTVPPDPRHKDGSIPLHTAIGETKSRRGRRQVNLTPRTVSALKAHRKRQLEERIKFTGLYQDHGLIFATRLGTPANPENIVKRSFKPLLEKAALPEIRFHDLRHTCATLLLGRGVHPKLVQVLLGHGTISMTLDTYSHYLPSMGDRAASAMGDALG